MSEETYSPTFQKASTIALLISAVALIAALGYLVFSLVNYSPSSDYQKKVVVNYMYGDSRIYDDTYHYYSGDNFMQLSLKNGAKRPLTNHSLLTDVGSIYWLKNGAVFNFVRYPVVNELSDMIQSQLNRLNEDIGSEDSELYSIEDLYWYINFTSGEISYLTYTLNPFGISTDSEGEYVYFTDESTNPGYTYFSSVSSSGDILRNIYGSSSATPSRIIGKDENHLYVIQLDKEDVVSLHTFNTSTYELKERIKDIYDDAMPHTVYEDVRLVGNNIVITSSTTSDTVILVRTQLSTEQKSTLFTGAESSVISYMGDGIFTITDTGDSLVRTHSIDINGTVVHQPVVTQKTPLTSELIFSKDFSLFIDRPYIYMPNGVNVTTINDKGVEAGFESETSSLERQILSQTADFNSYRLYISSGSLSEEYTKVTNYLEKIGVNRNDITILPQLSREASYDL